MSKVSARFAPTPDGHPTTIDPADSGPSTPTTASSTRTSTTRLDTLKTSELAVAIHAAGIPASWRSLTPGQIATLVDEGLTRLGLPEVQRRDLESRTIVLRMAAKHQAGQNRHAEHIALDNLWTSARLQQAAADLAYRLAVA